jgi:hypothetical protein
LLRLKHVPPAAGARELRQIRKLAQAALKKNREPADSARLGGVLARLSPAARDALARHAGARLGELPMTDELATGRGDDHELAGKSALLFGILSRLDLKPDRGRGKPPDHFAGMVESWLAYVYSDVTGREPSQGRGGRVSPFEGFVAAFLEAVGWRSAGALGAPRQARKAVEAVRDARTRRLERERARAAGMAEQESE